VPQGRGPRGPNAIRVSSLTPCFKFFLLVWLIADQTDS
jgi:hypothetical protein